MKIISPKHVDSKLVFSLYKNLKKQCPLSAKHFLKKFNFYSMNMHDFNVFNEIENKVNWDKRILLKMFYDLQK